MRCRFGSAKRQVQIGYAGWFKFLKILDIAMAFGSAKPTEKAAAQLPNQKVYPQPYRVSDHKAVQRYQKAEALHL